MIYSIGGYDLPHEQFRKIVETEQSRKKFILNVKPFLLKNKFEGLDIFWYSPLPQDKDNFQALMDELKVGSEQAFYYLENLLRFACVSSEVFFYICL